MKITRAQYQKLRQICNKFGVSPNQIHLKKVVNVEKRHLRRRFVLTAVSKWNSRRQKFYVRYNCFKRIDLRYRLNHPEKAQKRQRRFSWRRSIRSKNRSNAAVKRAKILPEDYSSDEVSLPEKSDMEVRHQIKTQLQLLQQGRRKSTLLTDNEEPNDSAKSKENEKGNNNFFYFFFK